MSLAAGHLCAQGPTPTLGSIVPGVVTLGTSVPVTLTGTNFASGATVAVSNPGVTVSNVAVVSATQITATFSIASNAALGSANVSVTTAGGTSGVMSFTVAAASSTLPTGWSDQDIGSVSAVGSASYDSSTGTFIINGSGLYIYYGFDNFNFAYQSFTGDGTIVARIGSVQNANTYSKVGVMIRETLDTSSRHVFMMVHPALSRESLLFRPSVGGTTWPMDGAGAPIPYWVKLVRQGNVFNGFVSADGSTWRAVGSPVTVEMGASVYVGLAVTANNEGGGFALTTATFDNVSVTAGVAAPVAVSVAPATASLSAGQNQEFTATVTGTTNQAVTWSLNPNVGTISSSGLYTAPATITAQQTVTVTATSVADQTKSGAATVTLVAAPAPTLTSINPSAGTQGTSVPVTLTGTNFASGATVAVSNPGVTVSNVAVVSATQITATFSIASNAALGSANVSVTTAGGTSGAVSFAVAAASSTLPAGWSDQDIGSVGVVGSADYNTGTNTFTVTASGTDIWTTADGFHYIYQSLAGDGAIIARVVGVQNPNTYTKVGVMVRENLDPGSRHAMVSVFQNSLLVYRQGTGASSQAQGGGGAAYPYWVKLVRQGNVLRGYVSPDGANWASLGTPLTIEMASTVYVGLAVTANTAFGSSPATTVTFDNVTVISGQDFLVSVPQGGTVNGGNLAVTVNVDGLNGFTGTVALSASGGPVGTSFSFSPASLSSGSSVLSVTVPAGTPAGAYPITITGSSGNLSRTAAMKVVVSGPAPELWASQDIGSVKEGGSTSYDGTTGTFTLVASGTDIWLGADGFRYVYKALTGDGIVVARVTGIQNPNGYTKAGVMMRESLAPESRHAMVSVFQQFLLIYRQGTGASSQAQDGGGGAYPCWVKLVRQGNVFSGYVSADGTAWTAAGGPAMITMGSTVYVGLALTANTDWGSSVLTTATFDNVSVASISTPAPTLVSVSPSGGTQGMSVPVTLTGTNFASGTTVAVSSPGVTVSNVVVASETQVTATLTIAGNATPGASNVTVTTPGGTSGAVSFTVAAASSTLPAGWSDQDIGSVAVAGSASYDSGTNTFVINGSGPYIWYQADHFNFAYQSFTGDGVIVARIGGVQNANTYSKVGVMIRETLDPASRHAFMTIYPAISLPSLLFRTSVGGTTGAMDGSGAPILGEVGAARERVQWIRLGRWQHVARSGEFSHRGDGDNCVRRISCDGQYRGRRFHVDHDNI